MINVLYGIQDELIENYINDFAKKNKIDNIIKFDYIDSDIDDLIQELSYSDLFGDKKLIVLYNSKFLTSDETLDSKSFESYLNNPNHNNYLFLITYNETLDERKKIVKLLRKNFSVEEFNKFTEYDAQRYINKVLKDDGYSIDEKTIKELIKRTASNIGLIKNEIEKLELYKLDNKNIELDDVINITPMLPEENVFKIVDALIDNNKEEIFRLYNDFKLIGIDEIALIALIANQFRFMYQVKVLLKDGKNKNYISNILKSHPYKTEITMKKVSSHTEEQLLNILYNLSLIDVSIKSGELDKGYALENFFLNL